MSFDLRCRVQLASPPSRVYGFLATDDGRGRFLAESSDERDGLVHLRFASGDGLIAAVLERDPPRRLVLQWFGGSRACFELRADGRGGTDLDLTESDVPDARWPQARSEWPLVLLALKAACDFGVDLRNHDPARGRDAGYVDA